MNSLNISKKLTPKISFFPENIKKFKRISTPRHKESPHLSTIMMKLSLFISIKNNPFLSPLRLINSKTSHFIKTINYLSSLHSGKSEEHSIQKLVEYPHKQPLHLIQMKSRIKTLKTPFSSLSKTPLQRRKNSKILLTSFPQKQPYLATTVRQSKPT